MKAEREKKNQINHDDNEWGIEVVADIKSESKHIEEKPLVSEQERNEVSLEELMGKLNKL